MARQQRPFAPIRDGWLEHHVRMTLAEIAVFAHLMSRANRRKGRIGLCEGLTGNRLANDMGKSRQCIHRALGGLASTKGPHGKRGRYIEVTPEGILVLNFQAKNVPDQAVSQTAPKKEKDRGPDASALGRIPAGCIPAGGGDCAGSKPAGIQPVPAVIQPVPAGIQPGISIKRRRRSEDVDVKQDGGSAACGASSTSPTNRDEISPGFSLTSEVEDAEGIIGPVSWDNEKEALSIDEEWLRDEIESYQSDLGVVLSRDEYEHEALRLRNELLRDTRLRACIRLAGSGKPSSASQFKKLATYVSGRFKEAIQRKSDRSKRPATPSYNSTQARMARKNEAVLRVMRETLEEDQREQKKRNP